MTLAGRKPLLRATRMALATPQQPTLLSLEDLKKERTLGQSVEEKAIAREPEKNGSSYHTQPSVSNDERTTIASI